MRTAQESLEAVVSALVNKGTVHVGLNRPEEALAVWEEVVQRFEKSNLPMPQNAVEMALFKKAGFELTSGRATAAIELVNSVLEREGTRLSEWTYPGFVES